MFSQRITAICLLVLYGALAAVGPYWHRHEHSCEHAECGCTSEPVLESHSDCSDRSANLASATPASTCPLGCKHDLDHAEAAASTQAQVSDTESLTSDGLVWLGIDRHGPCAICAYYAQAQVGAAPAAETTSLLAIHAIEELRCGVAAVAYSFCQARGPPCCA